MEYTYIYISMGISWNIYGNIKINIHIGNISGGCRKWLGGMLKLAGW